MQFKCDLTVISYRIMAGERHLVYTSRLMPNQLFLIVGKLWASALPMPASYSKWDSIDASHQIWSLGRSTGGPVAALNAPVPGKG